MYDFKKLFSSLLTTKKKKIRSVTKILNHNIICKHFFEYTNSFYFSTGNEHALCKLFFI